MNDEDLKKVLFVLYLLRNRVDEKNVEYAQDAIDLIENYFGIKIEKELQNED